MPNKCCLSLKASDLRHPITLESPVLNSDGSQSGSWKQRIKARAKIEPFAGRELLLSQQVSPRLTHRVTMRYRPGVVTDWRIRFRGRILHIDRSINIEERNRVLEIICVENTQDTV